jgi:hypothetical protein
VKRYSFIAVFLLLLGVAVGCSLEKEGASSSGATNPPAKQEVKKEVQKESEIDLSSLPVKLGQEDKEFILEVKKSSQTASLVIKNVEQKMEDAEENDEMDEVGDIVKSAKQDTLYIWNKTHNQFHPEDKTLQQLKAEYETILMNYRDGLSTEWEGMEAGDPIMMKQGFTQTEQARADFNQLYAKIKSLPQ